MFDPDSSALAQAIVDALRSSGAPPLVDRGAWQRWADRAGDGDDDAARLLLNAATTADATAAVAAACAAEGRTVQLHDGSTVPLAEAQRLLLRAEEDSVAPELRRAIAVGWPGLAYFEHQRSVAASLPAAPAPVDGPEVAAAAPAFLAATEAVAEAAHQVLQNAARSALERTHDVERAFDLPLPAELRGDAWLKGAVAELRDAAGAAPVAVTAIRVPAGLAGCVLTLRDAVRFGVPAGLVRAQALRASVAGAATAFVVAGAGVAADTAAGRAIGVGLLSEAGLRHAGVAPDVARATARCELAVGVLRARLLAAFVATDPGDGSGERERAHEASGRVLGVDASLALFDGLLAPLLPAVRRPLGRIDVRSARDALVSASRVVALRDAHDALFWSAPELWQTLVEAAASSSTTAAAAADGSAEKSAADHARLRAAEWAKGWEALCGECF